MTSTPDPPAADPRSSRLVSALEALLAACVVLGHNVWKALPNEVPILFLLGLVSYRLRDGSFASIGFRRPTSWGPIVAIAAGAAALRIGLGEWVVEPLAARAWPPIVAPSGANEIAGNPGTALLWLLLVWTFAAFGEEIAYRGYLLGRSAEALGRSPLAYAVGAFLSSLLFGFGHFYKGPAGIVDSGVAGLVLAGAYLLARRNLWAPVLAHGFIDTVAVAGLYAGWTS